MIYLASPYTDPNPTVREVRFRDACRAAAGLMRAGHVVFCPVAHSHPMTAFGLPTDWSYWEQCDREFLRRCDELVVLTLDGWRASVGVQAEIRLATELAKPVSFLDPENLTHGA